MGHVYYVFLCIYGIRFNFMGVLVQKQLIGSVENSTGSMRVGWKGDPSRRVDVALFVLALSSLRLRSIFEFNSVYHLRYLQRVPNMPMQLTIDPIEVHFR